MSAEDNFGIGGYDRVMGPNGQAQYWAPDLNGALDVFGIGPIDWLGSPKWAMPSTISKRTSRRARGT